MNAKTYSLRQIAFLMVALFAGLCISLQSANGQGRRIADVELGPGPNQVNGQGVPRRGNPGNRNGANGNQNGQNGNRGGGINGAQGQGGQGQDDIRQQMVQQAIQQFDLDGDQKLDASELGQMLNFMHEKLLQRERQSQTQDGQNQGGQAQGGQNGQGQRPQQQGVGQRGGQGNANQRGGQGQQRGRRR